MVNDFIALKKKKKEKTLFYCSMRQTGLVSGCPDKSKQETGAGGEEGWTLTLGWNCGQIRGKSILWLKWIISPGKGSFGNDGLGNWWWNSVPSFDGISPPLHQFGWTLLILDQSFHFLCSWPAAVLDVIHRVSSGVMEWVWGRSRSYLVNQRSCLRNLRKELRVGGMKKAGAMWVSITHFRIKCTRTYWNSGLYFPPSFRLNFIGTSLPMSECSHEFKNKFCHNVSTDLWISTNL